MQNLIKNKIFRFLPAILWMGFIFFLSSGSTSTITGTSTERFIILKSFHLIEYAILYLCFKFAGISTKNSILLAYLYALSDEFHQSFVPGRGSKFTDTLIDLVGVYFGYFSSKFISRGKY